MGHIASNLHFHSVRSAVLIVSVVVCLMSELGSNTATAILGFMLPVASPMQTIVFGTGRVPIRQMVKGGLYMDLIGTVLLMVLFGVVMA